MNDVVAVALITAASTLSAGALTGVFAYGAARRQVSSQEKQAEAAQAEQRSIRHREVRRDAYIRFLNQMIETHRFFDQLWMEELPSPAQPAIRQMIEHVDQTGKALAIVSLEGPPEVAERARAVFGLAAEEYDALREYVEGHGSGLALYQAYSTDWARFMERRSEVEQQLIERARTALGGDLSR